METVGRIVSSYFAGEAKRGSVRWFHCETSPSAHRGIQWSAQIQMATPAADIVCELGRWIVDETRRWSKPELSPPQSRVCRRLAWTLTWSLLFWISDSSSQFGATRTRECFKGDRYNCRFGIVHEIQRVIVNLKVVAALKKLRDSRLK